MMFESDRFSLLMSCCILIPAEHGAIRSKSTSLLRMTTVPNSITGNSTAQHSTDDREAQPGPPFVWREGGRERPSQPHQCEGAPPLIEPYRNLPSILPSAIPISQPHNANVQGHGIQSAYCTVALVQNPVCPKACPTATSLLIRS